MEKPRYLVIHIRLYRGKTNLVGLVGISIMHRDFSCQNGEGEKGKHRRETTLAPPLSRWRKGRWSRDDKSKRNAVDVWDASFDTRSNFLFPSLFHLDVTDPLIHRFPSWYRSSISNAFVFHFPLSFSPHISLDQLSLNTQFFFWIRTRSHLYRRTMQCTFRYHVCDTYGRERTWTENNGILIDKKKRKSIIGDVILIFFFWFLFNRVFWNIYRSMGDFLKCCFRLGEGIERIFARNNAINIERDAESAIDGCHTWVPVELRQLYATNRVDFGTILPP